MRKLNFPEAHDQLFSYCLSSSLRARYFPIQSSTYLCTPNWFSHQNLIWMTRNLDEQWVHSWTAKVISELAVVVHKWAHGPYILLVVQTRFWCRNELDLTAFRTSKSAAWCTMILKFHTTGSAFFDLPKSSCTFKRFSQLCAREPAELTTATLGAYWNSQLQLDLLIGCN